MVKTLVIRTSACADDSVSNRIIDAYLMHNTGADVTERNLDTDPVPHVTSANLAALGRDMAKGADYEAARALQETLIAEVFAADLIVIGLPLYNFGMPSTLKAWFDFIGRAGTTFRYTENGPEGLVTGKRVILVHTSGGIYNEADGFPFAISHTKALLGFVGITNVDVVSAAGLSLGPDVAKSAIDAAVAAITAL